MNKNFYLTKYLVMIVLFISIFMGSCVDLEEEVFGELSPENFYQTDDEIISALAGVYTQLSGYMAVGHFFRITHLPTDEFIILGRRDGIWVDGGIFYPLQEHRWDENVTSPIVSAYNSPFNQIGRANATIASLEASPRADELVAELAELRALRAYAYFMAMDTFGNVPIFTDARPDPSNLPSNLDTERSDVFDFIVTELIEASEVLPSGNDINMSDYYPRFTRETVYGILATMYLNAEVYTGLTTWNGESIWDLAADYAKNIIDSGVYMLEPEIIDNFTADNRDSREFLISISREPSMSAGGNGILLRTLLFEHQHTYDLPFMPFNGFSTYPAVLDLYEEDDDRREFILHGPQYTSAGDPLPSFENPDEQAVLGPIVDPRSAAHTEGYKVMKYQPDPNWVGRDGHNDFVLLRYADILLVRAEALLRAGESNNGEALDLVNEVRLRSNASQLDVVTLEEIEDERARELIWENARRRDMIRFGSFFTGQWQFKEEPTPEFMGVYPIPDQELQRNPNLRQNPGY